MDASASVGQTLQSPDVSPNDLANLTGTVPSSMPGQASVSASNPQSSHGAPSEPREVGTIKQELVERPLADIKHELGQLFSLEHLLGIENPKDGPEQKAKRQQMWQKYNQLSAEEKAIADARYQEQMTRKRQQEEEAQIRRQQEEAARSQSIAMPSSPQKGPPDQGGKSKSQAAMQQLKQDRTTIGKLQSAN